MACVLGKGNGEMRCLDEPILGAAILLMLGALVVVKRVATGSISRDRPHGGAFLWSTHVFSLFFLLVVNPLAALLLVTGRLDALDSTHVAMAPEELRVAVEVAGLVLSVVGYGLMAWALLSPRRSYQVRGSAPRPGDALVIVGPYRLPRHPMYASALCISQGLFCVTQSPAYLAVLLVYVALLVVLIPIEDGRLEQAYGPEYVAYRRKVHALLPLGGWQ